MSLCWSVTCSFNVAKYTDQNPGHTKKGSFFLHDERSQMRTPKQQTAGSLKKDDDIGLVWFHGKYEEMIALS